MCLGGFRIVIITLTLTLILTVIGSTKVAIFSVAGLCSVELRRGACDVGYGLFRRRIRTTTVRYITLNCTRTQCLCTRIEMCSVVGTLEPFWVPLRDCIN